MAFHAVAFSSIPEDESTLIATMTLGLDAVLLAFGYVCARIDNKTLAVLAAKTGRPLLPPLPLHRRLHDWRKRVSALPERIAPTPLPEQPTTQQRLRALCAEAHEAPDRLEKLLETIDRWQAISNELTPTHSAKTNFSLENLVRCAEALHAAPNLARDDRLVGEFQEAAYALTSSMEQDIAKVEENKAMALSAEMKAITKGMKR